MSDRPDFPDDTDVIVQCGEPFIPKGPNCMVINPMFFAEKFLKDCNLSYYEPGEWYESCGGRLRPLGTKDLLNRIRTMILRAVQESDWLLFDKITVGLLNEVLSQMKLSAFRGEKPVLSSDDIPVKNGLLHWAAEKQDFEFRVFTEEDHFLGELDVEYHPEEHSSYFEEKIGEILPDPDDRQAVQEYLAACLFSQNLTRKILVFQGEGGCGKSRLPILLTQILKKERVFELNVSAVKQNYEFSSLDGQTVFLAPESVADTFCDPEGINFLKKVTGGDFFQTRQKFCNAKVDHWGNFGVVIMTNHALRFQYDGRGEEFKDRLLLVVFDRHVSEERQDKELSQRFYTERNAIFNWFLEGARRVRRNSWNIELTSEQKSRRDQLIEASKGIEIFVQNFIVPSAAEEFATYAAYSAYTRFQKRNGFEFLPETVFQKRLARAMGKIYGSAPSRLKDGKSRGYQGYECLDFFSRAKKML